MGANPVFFDTSDLAVSLENGTVDGAMAAPTLYAPQKLYEFAQWCMALPGFTGGNACMMGTPFLDSLPDDLRQMVLDVAMQTIEEYTNDYSAEFTLAAIQTLEDNGCTVYEPNDTVRAQLEEAYAPMLDMWLEIEGAPELYEQLQALNDAYYENN